VQALVVTPMGTVLEDEVDEAVLPLADGWLGVLPGHAPFLARLMRGHVVLRSGERERIVATIGGMVGVDATSVTVLTGAAVADNDIATLERERKEQIGRIESLENEAEKHFDRVYRAMARTLNPGRERIR
jgi:F-type H+-transporting ATPase subunit epsilon